MLLADNHQLSILLFLPIYKDLFFNNHKKKSRLFSSKTDKDSSNKKEDLKSDTKPISIKVYDCFLDQKEQILKENKGKSGIYCLINKNNNKSYVGSAVKLHDRL
ncbi:hypothetical protein B8V09_03525 [Streptococcus agalactiae]|nr:hypothetical protein B8V09_03525 [Streptococcus agalactiae]